MRSSIVLAVAISAWTLGCGGDALNPGGTDDGACDASLGTSSDAPSGSSSEASSSSSPADAEAGSDALAAACPDAGLGAGALSTPHVPPTHRPSGSACPQTRGTQASTAGCTCAADGGACPCAACNTDSDCTKGPNGRCEASGPSTFKGCSYDQCFGDSDCMGGAPCECRASSASVVPNTCLGESNCAVDSDCGPGGYCSPSVVSNSCQCLGSAALCIDGGAPCYEGSNVSGPPPGNGWTEISCLCGDNCGHGYFCHTACDACIDDGDCGDQETCNYDVVKHIWACSECLGIP